MASFVQKAVARMKERSVEAAKRDAKKRARQQPRVREPIGRVTPLDEAHATTLAGLFCAVDQDALRRAGFLPPEKYERRMAEEYRHIKRPLLANAFGQGAPTMQHGNLLMVASAVSGEGKTHTCINLALSMAQEQDRTVLLVDADVAKPTVSRLFGLEDQLGLLDLVAGDVVDISQVMVETDVPKLRLLAAGKPRENATELLASDRMREVADELSTRYADRIIIFDSAPLLATSESVILADIVGQIAMVVAADSTPREAVREALGKIDADKAVNLILNKARVKGGGGYYGYGYGYGYGQYGYHGRKDEQETLDETAA